MAGVGAHTRYKLLSGEIVPSVTTIINSQLGWNKTILIQWARKEGLAGRDPNKVLLKAGDIGGCAHKLIEHYIKGQIHCAEPDVDLSEYCAEDIEKAQTAFQAFLDWDRQTGLTYTATEVKVISEEQRCGGRIDILAEKDGDLWLLDPKSSKAIYLEHYVQVAAYRAAYTEQEREAIAQVHLLHLDKATGGFADLRLSEEQLDFGLKVFKHCRALYDLKQGYENG